MDRTTAQEKGILEPEHLEIVQDSAAHLQPTHYRPQSDAEKRLDKKVNLKLDLIVVTLLAVEFIVGAPSRPRSDHLSTSLTSAVLRHRQDQCRFCCNQLLRQRCQLVSRRHPKFTLAFLGNLRPTATFHGHSGATCRREVLHRIPAHAMGRSVHVSCGHTRFWNSHRPESSDWRR